MRFDGPLASAHAPVKTVVLPVRLRQRLAAVAREQAPLEACGVLLGHLKAETPTFLHLAVGPNLAADPFNQFRLPGWFLRRIRTAWCTRPNRLVAVVHSHTEGGRLASDHDLHTMRRRSGLYVIVDQEGQIRVWLSHNRRIRQLRIAESA